MPALSKSTLKATWVSFFQPTSADFSNLIDSWTDYNPSLEVLGASVSGGSTGVPNFTGPSAVSFVAVGATGSALLPTGTAASARSVLGLGTLATQNTVSAANIDAASVSAAAIVDNSITLAKLARVGTSGQVLVSNGTGADAAFAWTGLTQPPVLSTLATVTAITAAMPYDDTPPLSSEGNEILTATITPRSATTTLEIEAIIYCASTLGNIAMGLFQDATVTARAAAGTSNTNRANAMGNIVLRHRMTSGTTSPTTFRIRAGAASGTLTINGESSARLFGGVLESSLKVTEIA